MAQKVGVVVWWSLKKDRPGEKRIRITYPWSSVAVFCKRLLIPLIAAELLLHEDNADVVPVYKTLNDSSFTLDIHPVAACDLWSYFKRREI